MIHWSTRLLARHLGVGDATVARAWRRYHVQPWRRGTFKFSTAPALEAKVRDVVGLYLDPPEKAMAKNTTTAADVNAYLAGLPGDIRTTLERLRDAIRATVPDVSENIS